MSVYDSRFTREKDGRMRVERRSNGDVERERERGLSSLGIGATNGGDPSSIYVGWTDLSSPLPSSPSLDIDQTRRCEQGRKDGRGRVVVDSLWSNK